MRRIFLSYRDEDGEYGRRLRSQLETTFGPECIADSTDDADALLEIIGPRWQGEGRVRADLEAAFERDLLIIPVLVGGAALPDAEELPESLRPLVDRYPLEIPEPPDEFDVEAVVNQLTEVVHPLAAARNGGGAEGAESPTAGAAPPMEPQLGELLREAALAGVVPALTVAPPQATAPPSAPVASGSSSPAPAPPPPAPPASQSPPPDAESRESRGVLPIVLALAVLGGGFLVVAKWLLGWFVTDTEVPSPVEDVVCTVFAPPSAAPGDSLLVQAFAHLPEQADDARAIAAELDTAAQRRAFQSLSTHVPHGSRLDFELRLPGLEVDEPVASLVWRGRPEAVQFGVQVPADAREGTVIGTLEVSLESAPIGNIKFKLAIDRNAASAASEPQGERARRYTAAFISYASVDREKVLARVQMLSVAGVRYFQDVLSMEPGDRWERKLELGIDECDVFLLFWSTAAKESEWVRKEVRYALARSAGDELAPPEIRPVILEGPPIVRPWEELNHLHFNDRLTYFMRPPGGG